MIVKRKNNAPDIPELLEPYILRSREIERGGDYEVILQELPMQKTCELVLEGATALREKVSAEKYKIEIILHRMELLTTVQGMIEQADMEVKIAWKHTKNIRRDSPTVATFAQALGLSDEDIDELFLQANQITI